MLATISIEVRPLSRVLKALADETRLRIVALLSHGELCVCQLEVALSLTQSNASRQLAVLRSAGLVDTRREGHWVYYRLAPLQDEAAQAAVKALTRSFARSEQLAEDFQQLLDARGPTAGGDCPRLPSARARKEDAA
jgi:ArsR family transcriptional regulator, arsenate/arsenite/antimonite-responsive transcriptional repressor